MFAPVSYEEVHAFVGQYLYRNASRRPFPFIERIGWGTYRLNRRSINSTQYLLKFQDVEAEEKPEVQNEDLSLSLF